MFLGYVLLSADRDSMFLFFLFLLAGEIVVVCVFSLDLCQKPVKHNVANMCVH